MIKIIKYVHNSIVHCVTIEFTHDNKPVFRAYYSEFEIQLMLSPEQHETMRDKYGQNICIITVQENPE